MAAPRGVACPRCGRNDRMVVHRRGPAPVLDFHCGHCKRVFNAFTGTALHDKRRLSQLVLIVRGFAQGVSTAQLAHELDCDRSEDPREDLLTEPGLGDRQVEQDLIGRPLRVECGSEGLLGRCRLVGRGPFCCLMLSRQVGDGHVSARTAMANSCRCRGRSCLAGQGAGAGSGIVSDRVAVTKQRV